MVINITSNELTIVQEGISLVLKHVEDAGIKWDQAPEHARTTVRDFLKVPRTSGMQVSRTGFISLRNALMELRNELERQGHSMLRGEMEDQRTNWITTFSMAAERQGQRV